MITKRKAGDYGLKQNQRTDHSLLKPSLRFLLFLGVPFLAFSVMTTQDLAKQFSYHASLGSPVFGQWYQPFAWVSWFLEWGDDYSATFSASIQFNLTLTLLVSAGLFLFFFMTWKARRDRHPDLHGSARLATFEDVQNMNILQGDKEEGIVIGGFVQKKSFSHNVKHYLYHKGMEHVLVFAPTGSGKGVGLVVPTLLSWKESAFVLDIKKELWGLTAGWRKKGANNRVLRFEPGCNDGTAACFNPLAEIRLGTDFDVSDAQDIATMIMDDEGRGLADYWSQAGFSFLSGLIVHECYKARLKHKEASLPDIAVALADPDMDIDDKLDEMFETEHLVNGTHPFVAQTAREMANKADKEMSGVVGTVSAKLGLYRNPIIAKNIRRSDFTIHDLMNNHQPVTLYMCTEAGDQARMKPLTRLVMTMILRGVTRTSEFVSGESRRNYKHRFLFLADEFSSLGKLSVFEETMPILRGYGVTCYLITQDLAQLRGVYGKDETIVANSHVRIAYAPNSVATAEELSRMTGKTTILKKDVSESRHSKGVFSSSRQSISYRETARSILNADEIMRLRMIKIEDDGSVIPGEMLLFIAGQPVIYGEQVVYFIDPVFKARQAISAPDTSDRCDARYRGDVQGKTAADRFSSRHDNALATIEGRKQVSAYE